MPPRTSPNASDHDLLIRIDTKVDVLQVTVQETRTALSARIDRLAQDKANYTDLDPLRTSIQRQQSEIEGKADKKLFEASIEKADGTRRLVYIGIGIAATLQFIAPFVWAAIFRK